MSKACQRVSALSRGSLGELLGRRGSRSAFSKWFWTVCIVRHVKVAAKFRASRNGCLRGAARTSQGVQQATCSHDTTIELPLWHAYIKNYLVMLVLNARVSCFLPPIFSLMLVLVPNARSPRLLQV